MAAEPQPTPDALDPHVIYEMLGKHQDAATLLSQFHLPIMCRIGDPDRWSINCNIAMNSETHKLLMKAYDKNVALQTLARLSCGQVDAGPDCVMVLGALIKPAPRNLQDPRFRARTNEEAARLLLRTLVSLLRWIHGGCDVA